MIDIFGDEICWLGQTVGRLTIRTGGLRDDVESFLTQGPEGYVSEEDHAAAIEEAEDKAREAGKGEGAADAETKFETELQDRFAEIRREAFDLGRAKALEASGRVADVERVDALLAAFTEASDAMATAFNRKGKAADLRAAVAAAVTKMHLARRDYRAPLPAYDLAAEIGLRTAPASATLIPAIEW